MKTLKSIFFTSALSSAITVILILVFFEIKTPQTVSKYIPEFAWPEFDKKAPYLLNGPLWVGYDTDKQVWKYLKIPFSETRSELQRGLIDPGNPSNWDSNLGEIGSFNFNLQDLPSGTHINNRYNPNTLSYKYKLEDIMVKVGNFWVDKYESSLIILEAKNKATWIDDPKFGGIGEEAKSSSGNAYDFSQKAISVSQRRRGSSGLTYFVAEQAAVNNGKHIIRNEQWQAAASGTSRSDASGMQAGGEDWKIINDSDISRFGVVGCAGSLWEWTSSWGQYGEHYVGEATNWYDWPGPNSYVEWDDKFDSYGNDIAINVAGRAYTAQDSGRYASGLPAALVRGGGWGDHNRAGIFALIADGAPSYYGAVVGFRCVK